MIWKYEEDGAWVREAAMAFANKKINLRFKLTLYQKFL